MLGVLHRSGRSASLEFRNFFGGHSVMVAVELNRFANRILSRCGVRSLTSSSRTSLLKHSRTFLGATILFFIFALRRQLRFGVGTCSERNV
jgi:hypothetical protein